MKVRRTYGFTLIEMVVVIAIMLIILAVSAPRVMQGIRYGELRNAADQLLSTARYAQGMAAIQQVTYRLTIDIARDSFYITRDAGKHDDFTLTESDFMASESSLFPGERMRTTPDTWEDQEVDPFFSPQEDTTNSASGRVTLFDGETEYLCGRNVNITSIHDARGDRINKDEYTIPFNPHGTARESTIYLTLGEDDDDAYQGITYVVYIAGNGSTHMFRKSDNDTVF